MAESKKELLARMDKELLGIDPDEPVDEDESLIGGQCEHGNASVLQCYECNAMEDKAAVPDKPAVPKKVVEKMAKQLVVKMVQALLDDPVRMQELTEKTFELYDKGESNED